MTLFEKWVSAHYPMMFQDKDYAELDYGDMQEFAMWCESKMPRWISVDERLPHLAVGAEWTGLSHNCFVLGDGIPESMAYYSFNDMKWKCSVNTGEVLHGVTHWRPRT